MNANSFQQSPILFSTQIATRAALEKNNFADKLGKEQLDYFWLSVKRMRAILQ